MMNDMLMHAAAKPVRFRKASAQKASKGDPSIKQK